jgi:hypothetical protein
MSISISATSSANALPSQITVTTSPLSILSTPSGQREVSRGPVGDTAPAKIVPGSDLAIVNCDSHRELRQEDGWQHWVIGHSCDKLEIVTSPTASISSNREIASSKCSVEERFCLDKKQDINDLKDLCRCLSMSFSALDPLLVSHLLSFKQQMLGFAILRLHKGIEFEEFCLAYCLPLPTIDEKGLCIEFESIAGMQYAEKLAKVLAEKNYECTLETVVYNKYLISAFIKIQSLEIAFKFLATECKFSKAQILRLLIECKQLNSDLSPIAKVFHQLCKSGIIKDY